MASTRWPAAVTPAGPSTSGPPPKNVSYSELKAADHFRVAVPLPSENLSTLPVCDTPNCWPEMGKNLPASAT